MSYYCPHCGTKLEFVVRPKFCPECGESTAPGAKKAAALTSARPSNANFRRPVHDRDEYEGEIREVPEIDGLSLSCEGDFGRRAFTIQDVINNRVSTAGKRVVDSEAKNDVLAEMKNEVKSSVDRLRSNQSDD